MTNGLGMFLLRYRRPQRYSEEAVRKALEPLPSLDNDPDCGPDPDEAMGRLEYYLDELTDYGAPPTEPDEPLRANDGVDFVDFQREQPSEDGEDGGPDAPGSLIPTTIHLQQSLDNSRNLGGVAVMLLIAEHRLASGAWETCTRALAYAGASRAEEDPNAKPKSSAANAWNASTARSANSCPGRRRTGENRAEFSF